MSKILFYIERDLHIPFLLPVLEQIKKYTEIDTAFSAPAFIPPTLQKPGNGIDQKILQKIKQYAPFFEHPEDFSPDLTVIADACQYLLPEYIGPTVNTGHGLICKGAYYTPLPRSCKENLSSTLCVPGPWHKKRLQEQVHIPTKVTGFIKTDHLINAKPTERNTFNKQHNLSAASKNILYAPTFNQELSSLPWLLPYLQDLTALDANLLIKLHNMTPPEWVDACHKLKENNAQITVLEDSDYSQMMQHADLMLSDVSSIFVEFMLMDKPVVLFRQQKIKNFNRFDPTDIEYQVTEAVSSCSKPEDIKQTVQKELESPNKKSELRKRYRQALDYKRDGKSAQRAADVILENLQSLTDSKHQAKDKFFILIDAQDSDQTEIEKSLQEIQLASPEQSIQSFCWTNSGAKNNNLTVPCINLNNLKFELDNSRANHILLLKAGFHLPYNWAKHMLLHMYWEKKMGIVRALAQKEIVNNVLKHYGFNNNEHMPDSIASHSLRTIAIESRAVGIAGPSPCILAPIELAQEVLYKNNVLSVKNLSHDLHQLAITRGNPVFTALDIYIYPFCTTNNNCALY